MTDHLPGVFGQRRTVFIDPAEAECAGVWLAAASIIVGEEDAAEGERPSMSQVTDFGKGSDGEKREVNICHDVSTVQADIGAGVFLLQLTQLEGAVGCDGHAAEFVRIRFNLPPSDLVGVPDLASLVEGPVDEGAVWGDQAGAWQDGIVPKSPVYKHCVFFAPHTWKHQSQSCARSTVTLYITEQMKDSQQ